MTLQHRLYQKAYCSTLDWKSGVVLLHEKVATLAKQAARTGDHPGKQLELELRALKILQFLMANIAQAKEQPAADRRICGQLLREYGHCALYLSEGKDLEAASVVHRLLKT
ncbi:MAG: hypothetical protein K0R75_3499 [Paenibacillaceae bacterium]|jgi:hypothetical protein|nr:hypothetical protein [Paenibacillaceae bacterium]